MLNFYFLIISLPIILLTITIHEFAHGKVADILGDPTPRYAGRLTLNPISHIDPIGFLMLILVRFGWAKPVPINPYNFKNPKAGMALVSVAGPGANLFFAWFLAWLTKAGLYFLTINPVILNLLEYTIWLNIALAIFNLIPIPPLDGSNILQAFIPERYTYIFSRLQPYGFIILVAFLLFGGFKILTYLVSFIYRWLM